MHSSVRERVRLRADHRCEYCRLPQAVIFFAFHIEHIRARQHGGNDDPENLALACPFCNRYKGPNLTSIDPETNQTTELFNPRVHSWKDHFATKGSVIVGQSPIGRATAKLLQMNSSRQIEIRAELIATGAW